MSKHTHLLHGLRESLRLRRIYFVYVCTVQMVAVFVSNMAQKEFHLKHIGSSIQLQILRLCLFFFNLRTTTVSFFFFHSW